MSTSGTIAPTATRLYAAVTKAPTAVTGLEYNGSEQELCLAGAASNGTMKYAATTSSSSTAPTSG